MAMTREEFMNNPSDFSFCLNPLDVNLAKMQMNLQERMKTADRIAGAVLDSIVEKYVAENPLREYGEITIEIYKYRGSLSGSLYRARIIVADKTGYILTVALLYEGDWSWMERFIGGKVKTWGGKWDFFTLCKANALWLDYCMKNEEFQHLRLKDDTLLSELQNEVDYLTFSIDGKKVFCHGHPALQTRVGFAIGESMGMFRHENDASLYIVNIETNEIMQLVDATGHVVGFEEKDFDWEKLKTVEHRRCLDNRVVDYAGIGRYSDYCNGICCLSWMLYPDGRYFADSDGFGMEDNDEEIIYCIIDKHFNVIVPFQPMTDKERKERINDALKIIHDK